MDVVVAPGRGVGEDERPGHLRVRVDGLVQGVGYRVFVRTAAVRLGVVGWVFNLEDGGVEVAAWGAPAAIDRLREDLLAGPPGAVVHEVGSLADAGDCPPADFSVTRRPPGEVGG